jgi:hypothetical protein
LNPRRQRNTQKWYEFYEQLPQLDRLHVGILHPSQYMRILCTRHSGSLHGESIAVVSGVSGKTREVEMASITQRPASRQYCGALCAAQQHRIEDQTRSSRVRAKAAWCRVFPFSGFGPFSAQKRRVKDRVQLTCSRSRVEGSLGGTQRLIRPRGRPWPHVA